MMMHKRVWLSAIAGIVIVIGGFLGYRYYTNQNTVPQPFAGHQLATSSPNKLYIDMTLDFANGHAYLTPTGTYGPSVPSGDLTGYQLPVLHGPTKSVFKLVVNSTKVTAASKVVDEAGQRFDLGRVQFTKSGEWWTMHTPKLTLQLKDRKDSSFESKDGTFWLLRQDSTQ